MKGIILAAVLLLASAIYALGQQILEGYTVPDETLSPDGHYGVTVPLVDGPLFQRQENDATNSLVSMKDKHVLAVIKGETGWDRALNFWKLGPTRWSSDGSLLLWEVKGKWCPNTLTALKINGDKVEWQTDILHLAQQAIIARTKKASPRKFAAAKKCK